MASVQSKNHGKKKTKTKNYKVQSCTRYLKITAAFITLQKVVSNISDLNFLDEN